MSTDAVEVRPSVAAIPATPGRRERILLRLLQIGASLSVVAAVTYFEYELDRFYVPKELVLHLVALAGCLVLLPAIARTPRVRAEYLLFAFLLVGLVSAGFATNLWVALRALTISASGIALFLVGREMRRKGLARPLLVAVAIAVVIGCATALLQAYGVETEFFSINRAPGGTMGNRNSVAHLAAFGFPVVLLCALRAWRPVGYLGGAIGVVLVTGTLVMTRSRAGWLAFGAALIVVLASFLLSGPVRRSGRAWLRLLACVPVAAVGVLGAVFLPNSLNWRSDNPYLDSVQGIANYQEGSGRGRLVQYRQSLKMTIDHPLLGVGPGNWPVRYAEYAADGDPSLSSSDRGTTANPWPSSDWVAFLAERGVVATLLLLSAAGLLIAAAFRRIVAARDADEGLQSGALLATVLGAGVAGAFDAVLLLGMPSLLVWLTLGLLYPPDPSASAESAGKPIAGWAMLGLLIVLSGIGTFRSGAQLLSMAAYTRENSALMLMAAKIDPGDYRLQLKLAGQGGGRSREVRCRHALAARDLFPNARAARNAADGCGE